MCINTLPAFLSPLQQLVVEASFQVRLRNLGSSPSTVVSCSGEALPKIGQTKTARGLTFPAVVAGRWNLCQERHKEHSRGCHPYLSPNHMSVPALPGLCHHPSSQQGHRGSGQGASRPYIKLWELKFCSRKMSGLNGLWCAWANGALQNNISLGNKLWGEGQSLPESKELNHTPRKFNSKNKGKRELKRALLGL